MIDIAHEMSVQKIAHEDCQSLSGMDAPFLLAFQNFRRGPELDIGSESCGSLPLPVVQSVC